MGRQWEGGGEKLDEGGVRMVESKFIRRVVVLMLRLLFRLESAESRRYVVG